MDSDDSLLAKIAASPALAPPRAPGLGTRRFELGRRLGAGSFGEVYDARDRESGSRVAVKVLRASGPDRLFRFKREFRAVADIVHPNLVRLHELIQEGEQWFLAMELVDGLPFGEHVRRAPEQVRGCFAQLAQAVDALHRARCIHRDIKPTNVLVERTGRVVLLDFGLAVALEASEHTVIAGTPQYMAPEQMMGSELTAASDWYAFGVMLYEALAGRRPFDVPNDRLLEAKNATPEPPSHVREDVDEELERLCLQLLLPDASARPPASVILSVLASVAIEHDDDLDREPFAGRARELSTMHASFDAIDDTGAMVLVEGHAGIGKTSLVRTFERSLDPHEIRFYSGRCHEAESVPFKGIDAIVDAISEDLRRRTPLETASLLPRRAAALATMFPVLKRVEAFAQARVRDTRRSPLEMRRAAVDALRELVTRLSDESRVVLFIDDVQWATVDGLNLLFDLLAPPTPPVLFVIAYRAEAVGRTPALDRLLGRIEHDTSLRTHRLSLPPLSEDEIAELLGSGHAANVAAVALRETGGHPFLLSRLLRRTIPPGSTGRRMALARLLDEQLARLSFEARSILEAISLSAAPLTQEAACHAAGLPRWDAAKIDELRLAKLVRSLGRNPRAALEPYHDHVRERLIETMTSERRRAVHANLAEFLEKDRRVDADAIAHHHAAAENAERAIAWMRRAALEATDSLAFARAAELYAKAAAIAVDADDRIDLVIDHADALVLASRRNDAARACLDAQDLARELGVERRVTDLRALAGEHFMLGGDFHQGTALLSEALANVGVVLPETTGVAMAETINMQVALVARGFSFVERADADLPATALRRLDLELAAARSLAQTDIRAPWLSVKALLEALDLGEPRRIQRALVYFGFVNAARLADHPLGDDVLANGEALAWKLQDEIGLAWAVLARGLVLLYRRRIKDSALLLRDAERRFLNLRRPLLREAGLARIGLVTLGGSYGHDLPFAREMSRRWIEEALEHEELTPVTWLRLMSTWVYLADDDVAGARSGVAFARQTWSSVEGEVFSAAALISDIAIAIYEDPASAWAVSQELDGTFARLFASMLSAPRIAWLRHRATAALCAFVTGRASRADTISRVQSCVDEMEAIPNARDTADVLRGQLAVLGGDRVEAARLFRAAAEGFARESQATYELLALRLAARVRDETEDPYVFELRALGIVSPDRYGVLFVGPPLDQSSSL